MHTSRTSIAQSVSAPSLRAPSRPDHRLCPQPPARSPPPALWPYLETVVLSEPDQSLRARLLDLRYHLSVGEQVGGGGGGTGDDD